MRIARLVVGLQLTRVDPGRSGAVAASGVILPGSRSRPDAGLPLLPPSRMMAGKCHCNSCTVLLLRMQCTAFQDAHCTASQDALYCFSGCTGHRQSYSERTRHGCA
eukprot:366075-Chlamydomonas_euryale.AAC.5